MTYDMCEGQGHRSKIEVTGCQNLIFGLEKNPYLMKCLGYGHRIWSVGGCR